MNTVLQARPRNFVSTPTLERTAFRALRYLKSGYSVHLKGPAGTGKTTLALHLADLLGRPIMLLFGDDEFKTSDLIGNQTGYTRKKVVDNYIHSVMKVEDELRHNWIDSRLTLACREGFTLVYDEFNRSRPEVNNVLLSALEEKLLVLPPNQNRSEYIRVSPHFRAIFTSNPEEYCGVHGTQDALQDRLITINMPEPDELAQQQILTQKVGIDAAAALQIVRLVKAFQADAAPDMISSLRPSLMIATICNDHGIVPLAENSDFRDVCSDVLLDRSKHPLPEATRHLWDLFNQFVVSQVGLAEQFKGSRDPQRAARLHGEDEDSDSPAAVPDSEGKTSLVSPPDPEPVAEPAVQDSAEPESAVGFEPDSATDSAPLAASLAADPPLVELAEVESSVAIDESVLEAPVLEAPVAEEPVAEEPVAEEPVLEAPVLEAPVLEAPVAEEPVAEEPVAEEPVADEPVLEAPVLETPVPEEPVLETWVAETEDPIAAIPTPAAPELDGPSLEAPVLEEPVFEDASLAESLALHEFAVEKPVLEEAILDEPRPEEDVFLEEPILEAPELEEEAFLDEFVPNEPVLEEEAFWEEPVLEEPVLEEPANLTPEPVALETPAPVAVDRLVAAGSVARTEPTRPEAPFGPPPVANEVPPEAAIETRIFDFLDTVGSASFSRIETDLGLTRFQVVNALKSMLDQGLIEKGAEGQRPSVYQIRAEYQELL